MKKVIMGLAAVLTLSSMPQWSEAKTDKKDPVVMTIDGRDVKRSEFEYFYNKNNSQDVAEEKTFDEYVELFVNYKLKVAEAYRQGVDTTQAYKDELAGYRKQLVEPYLQIQGWPDSLLQQVKERRKVEVHASHLLLTCNDDSPKATVDSLYQVLVGYQHEVEAGASFDSLARLYSQDPSARQNAGDLGYFSALQMVYPFEQAAFNTPVGKTTIARSRFGLHLIKVIDKRQSEGEVLVAHIMKNIPRGGLMPEGMPDPKQQIDSIYAELQQGANWDATCADTSDDQYTAAKGGAYPWLNRAARFPKEWLDVCYALKEPGQYSEPFATQFGWHIVKLLDKRMEAPADSAQDARLKEQLAKEPDHAKAGVDAFVAQCRAKLAKNKKLAKQAAACFPDADIEIVETHHNRKVDAPSGTAMMLFNALREVRPNAVASCGRSGEGKRTKEEIGISALRLGSVVGIHEVIIHTGTQCLTLKHEAVTRAMLAEGAADAARFLLGKAPGMYDMQSMLK